MELRETFSLKLVSDVLLQLVYVLDVVLAHRHKWVALVDMCEAREGVCVYVCMCVRTKFNKQRTHIG